MMGGFGDGFGCGNGDYGEVKELGGGDVKMMLMVALRWRNWGYGGMN